MISPEMAGSCRGDPESEMSLVHQTEVIQALQTIRLELDEAAPSKRKITVAAGMLNLYAPWVLDRLFEADPGLARLIMIGEGNHGQRD